MSDLNSRNWERLLLATLARVRDSLPGPGITEADLERLDSLERNRARLGIDIDDLLEQARERESEAIFSS